MTLQLKLKTRPTADMVNQSGKIDVQVLKHCKGFPLAITVVGRSLCGQPIEIWQKRLIEWSKGSSILNSDHDLLVCLQSSLDALEKESITIKECFLDLSSFPEDHRIPATTLIDIWGESYKIDEDWLCIANLCELTNRNLANLIVTRYIGFYISNFLYVSIVPLYRLVASHEFLFPFCMLKNSLIANWF